MLKAKPQVLAVLNKYRNFITEHKECTYVIVDVIKGLAACADSLNSPEIEPTDQVLVMEHVLDYFSRTEQPDTEEAKPTPVSVKGYEGKWYVRGTTSTMVLVTRNPDGSGAYQLCCKEAVSEYIEPKKSKYEVAESAIAWSVREGGNRLAVFCKELPKAKEYAELLYADLNKED